MSFGSKPLSPTKDDIPLELITVTQDHVRAPEIISGMIDHVSNGGQFSLEEIQAHDPESERIVHLSRFEDGRLFLHDGHHRCASKWLAGTTMLHPGEWELSEWKYSDYTDIVFNDSEGKWVGWVTPFDIRTHVRRRDFLQYKTTVMEIYDNKGEMAAIEFIESTADTYSHERTLTTIPELALHLSSLV